MPSLLAALLRDIAEWYGGARYDTVQRDQQSLQTRLDQANSIILRLNAENERLSEENRALRDEVRRLQASLG